MLSFLVNLRTSQRYLGLLDAGFATRTDSPEKAAVSRVGYSSQSAISTTAARSAGGLPSSAAAVVLSVNPPTNAKRAYS